MTFDTLLVPTDGSDPAEAAARRGFDLADALEANVHVLSVADSSVATGTGYSGDSTRVRERLRETARARATALEERASARGLEATATIREGIPAKEIVDAAADHDVDAIVMGTAGRSGVSRAIVGSVTDKVVRTASVPVFTVAPDATDDGAVATTDSILLPTDGSAPAEAAARRGLDLATALEATVHLISIVDSSPDGTLGFLSDDGSPDDLLERASDHLAALADDARDRGLEFVTVTTVGDPAEEIVSYADAEGIDAIAMGVTGRGGFERFLMGSVADEVLRTATVPVLTTRPTGSVGETDD